MLRKLIKLMILLFTLSYLFVGVILLFYHRINIPQFDHPEVMNGKALVQLIMKIRPLLAQLIHTKNFKYFRVDLE